MTKLHKYRIIIDMDGKKVGDEVFAKSKDDLKKMLRNPAYKLFGLKIISIERVYKNKFSVNV